MIKKAYLEITNVCNLNCSFCHGTKRKKKYISEEEFRHAAEQIRPLTKYVYLHVMGEPLLHPRLKALLDISEELGLLITITTNGTLLSQKEEILLSSNAIRKISISLHSHEANDSSTNLDNYLDACLDFCKKASNKGIITVMRLWNIGGENKNNSEILKQIEAIFPLPWKKTTTGFRLSNDLYLEWGDKFEWPDSEIEPISEHHSCYGLRDQIGILSDGSVVPCCLDAEGDITLGNIFTEELSDILASKRANDLKHSFENGCVKEPLCQRCGFAASKFRR